MANPYKGDEAGARAFLNSLGVDTSRMTKASYVERIAGQVERQLAQGLPVNTQAARGHSVTPEHPGRAAPLRSEYQQAPTRAQRPSGSTQPQYLPGNDGAHFYGHTKADAKFAASVADQIGGNIQMSYRDKAGNDHVLFRNGGIRPEAFREMLSQLARARAGSKVRT